MSVFHAFFRAKKSTTERPIPWPDIPVSVEGAVIVGRIGQSVNYIWQINTQNPDDSAAVQELPGFFAPSYALLKNHANGQDVLEAIVEEAGPEGPTRHRVKMRNKPPTGVIEEDVIPHQFAGIPA